MTSCEVLKTLGRLKEELRAKYHVRALFLFGSVARGDSTQQSDIDVLVDFDETADLFHFTGLSIFLEEKLGRPVDVVPRDSLRRELRSRVLAEAVPV